MVRRVVLTGFGLSSGLIVERAWSRTRPHPRPKTPARFLAALSILGAGVGFAAVAIASQPLGTAQPVNAVFGVLHAGLLAILGATAERGVANAWHTLELLGLYLERAGTSLAAAALWLIRAVLALAEWLIRLVAVFGHLVIRPRPPVSVGVVQLADEQELPRELRAPARRVADQAYGRAKRGEHA